MTIHIRRGSLPIDDCTLIPTAYARDARLSLEARGVLAWLMTQPGSDEITEDQIIAAGPDGRAAVRLMLRELEQCGYLIHEATTYILTAPADVEGNA